MSGSYTQAVADGWTDMAPWLTGTGDDDFAHQVVGGRLDDFSGSDHNIVLCSKPWVRDGDFNYTATGLSVAAFVVTQGLPGQVAASNLVLGPLNFQNLTVTGHYRGSQKCIEQQKGITQTKTQNCNFDFSYVQSSGRITYDLATGSNSISITSVSVTNSDGGPPSPNLSIYNYTGADLTQKTSYVTGQLLAKMPALFASARFSALLINVLNSYVNG